MLLSIAQAGQSIDKMFSNYGVVDGYGPYKSPKDIRIMTGVRRSLTDDGFIFNHDIANQAIRNCYKRLAQRYDARLTVSIRCINKGHVWRVRSQAAWDAGYDEPVICQRCGEWDM
jgi:hypothetical protein